MRSEFVVVRKDIGKMNMPYRLHGLVSIYMAWFSVSFFVSRLSFCMVWCNPAFWMNHWETTYRNENEGISYYEETMFNFTARTHYPYTLFFFPHFWHLELIFVLHFARMPLNIYQKL